jgi:hypothetical protein
MKRRCLYCGKRFDDQEGKLTVCPHCHEDNVTVNLSDDQVHHLHQSCHYAIEKANDLKNNGLTFVVIGTILLIVGLLFLFLSFRFNSIRVRVFVPGSTEFVVCLICLALAAFSLPFGITRFLLGVQGIRRNKKTIQDTELKK